MMYKKVEVSPDLLENLFSDIDNLLVCNSSKLLLSESEKTSLFHLKSFIIEELASRINDGRVNKRISIKLESKN